MKAEAAMAEEEKKADALSFEDDDAGNFAHLMGGQEFDEKPKMDLGKSAQPKAQSDAGPRLQK